MRLLSPTHAAAFSFPVRINMPTLMLIKIPAVAATAVSQQIVPRISQKTKCRVLLGVDLRLSLLFTEFLKYEIDDKIMYGLP